MEIILLRRSPIVTAFLALMLAFPVFKQANAAGPEIPTLWDTKERLPKPDLSALPRLRFLTTTDFPPFNFFDDQGRLSGFHIDLARAICAELGVAEKCQIQALPWKELDGALQAGEGEAIVAGTAVTAASRGDYAFTRPYLQFPARFIMPKATAVAEPIWEKLQGKRVGVLGGSAHERVLRDYFDTVKVVAYASPDKLYEGLKAGEIDAAFGDGLRLSFWLASPESADCCRFAGGPYLAPDYVGAGLAIATRKQDDVLLAAFNYALQEITVKGTFAELYLRYFPIGFY